MCSILIDTFNLENILRTCYFGAYFYISDIILLFLTPLHLLCIIESQNSLTE